MYMSLRLYTCSIANRMGACTQRAKVFYEICSPMMELKSFKNEPYDVNVDEVDSGDYRYEAIRLKSFENWPAPYVKPEKLVAAGFYYIGELDIVKCFECGTEIYKWEKDDEPMVDHKRQSPACNFVRNFSCNNIAVDELPDISIASPVSEDHDVCGPYKYNSAFDHCNFDPTNSSFTHSTYPEYARCEARLRSFSYWPTYVRQNPEQLSLAGFYYTGRDDQVLCFHCGVALKDWEPEDDPWEQHAIWYPNCNYLLKIKGSKYVKEAGRTVPSEDTAPCVAKMEQSVYNADSKMKHIKFTEEDCLPGPSSQGSDDAGAVESMPSNNSLVKDFEKNLSDTQLESSKPISDTRICKICFDAELSQLFLPCSHLLAYADCAKCIKICPMCRGLVTGRMKVFML